MIPVPMLNVVSALTIATAPPIVLSSQLDGLHIEWSVDKAIGPEPDHAEIAIFNMSRVLRTALQVAYALPIPMLVTLLVGWGGIAPVPAAPELLFTGPAHRVRAERRTGVDVITTLECGDGLDGQDAPPAGGAAFGMAASLLLASLLGQMGMIPAPSTAAAVEAAAAAVPGAAWGLDGSRPPREQLDAFMATIGLSWGVSGGLVVVYRKGLRLDLPAVPLTPASGLLSVEPVDDGGIAFEALAQPRVVPGCQILVSDSVVGGTSAPMPVRVERVSFRGTSDGPSLMSGIARRVDIL